MTEAPAYQPWGKERVRLGIDKVFTGILETVSNEVKHGGKVAVVGLVVGAAVGLFDKKNGVRHNAWEFAKAGAKLGALWGWETAHVNFNDGLPHDSNVRVGAFDWVAANVINIRRELGQKPVTEISDTKNFLYGQFFNPTTTSGLKDIVVGGFQTVVG